MAFSNLLYLADVPLENLYSGSSMMFRLLEDYPKNHLRVYQGDSIDDTKRIGNIHYSQHKYYLRTLEKTRLSAFYKLLNIASLICFVPRGLTEILKTQRPQVIVTVAHGLLWILAYRVSRREGIPLVICVHDDPRTHSRHLIVRQTVFSYFKKAYKHARSRLCISDMMVNDYKLLMGVDGKCLYPPKRKNQETIALRPNTSDSITIAYAGTLEVSDYLGMIIDLANILKPYRSKIIVYSMSFPQNLKQYENIEYKGFIEPQHVLSELGKVADVLFLPFSFVEWNFITLAFPSKLADYTSLAIPILFWAPASSAVGVWLSSTTIPGKWVSNRGDVDSVKEAVGLLTSYEERIRLGQLSVEVGKRTFDHTLIQQIFWDEIKRVGMSNN